jgi:hypothetical protein
LKQIESHIESHKAGGGSWVVAHSAAGPLGGLDERLLPDLSGRLLILGGALTALQQISALPPCTCDSGFR